MSGPAGPSMSIFPGQQPRADDPASPAIDHAGGVARLMGDASLFARVLGRFRNEYRQAAHGIHAALDGGDAQTALRLAHTLKGAAGMIEAVPLRREAQRLEQALRGGGDPAPVLARLGEELARVLAELDAFAASMPERHGGRSDAAPSAQAARGDALERLALLLDEGNGDAVDLVHDAAAALAARLGPERYLGVAQAIDAFDFDGALDMVRQVLEL